MMRNLKNILDVCDIYISGEFVGCASLDFYPACGLHALVIKKMNFGFTESYSILVPAADFEYVRKLNLVSGEGISVPVKVNFDCEHPIIWLSDRCHIAKK
ncbi:hypothetical protein HP572_08770 [Pectobacterium sp. PL64]|uniref:hypothetical protein n=1 Tax=Pectobacterium sp. PL64 TaxID=2738983 RepID=UPI001F0BF409|nr:hypothetical protein [Pectobacterium sp. PL64]UMO89594.1 hypothetical protein HP572_08770 [Pectobacterium sp. PL64]